MRVLFRQLILCGAASLAAVAGAEEPLTLPAAIKQALAGNPELAAARQQVAAATGRAHQSRLWPNPELELSAADVPTRGGGLSESVNMIGVSQTVPFPGKKSLDARIGRQEISAAESESRAREVELVRSVTAAFQRAVVAEKKVAVSEQLVALAQSLADAARQRVAAGAASDQERLRAEIELDRAGVELAAERGAVAEARQTLARLLGRPREPLGALQGEVRETLAATDYETLRSQMLAEHPAIRGALTGRERAELEWQRAKREPLPDVTLGVAGGRDRAVDATLMEFRVSLPLPLFDRAQGRKRETRALAEIARYDLTATEQRLLEEFGAAEARRRAASEQVAAYRERLLPRAEEALKLVRGGFDAGKFGFLDLVDTQRTLAEARLGYLDKLLELNLAVADIEALAGTQTKE